MIATVETGQDESCSLGVSVMSVGSPAQYLDLSGATDDTEIPSFNQKG